MKQVATRDIKLETIRRSVEDCDTHSLPAIKEELIACCASWWGTARRTALEYLFQLEHEESIHIDEEDVWTYARWEKIKTAHEKDYLKGKQSINKTFESFNV